MLRHTLTKLIKKDVEGNMKLLSLGTALLAVMSFSSGAFASSGGGESKGFELVPAVFANQTSQNNASNAAYRVSTTEMDVHVDAGYVINHFYLGAVYYNGNVDAVNYQGANTENKTLLQWAGPSIGFIMGGLRLMGGYVVYASDSVYNLGTTGTATTYNYSSGTGPFGSISYAFHVTPKFFIAPTIDVYQITFTIGQTATAAAGSLARNYDISGIAPFLGFGFDL